MAAEAGEVREAEGRASALKTTIAPPIRSARLKFVTPYAALRIARLGACASKPITRSTSARTKRASTTPTARARSFARPISFAVINASRATIARAASRASTARAGPGLPLTQEPRSRARTIRIVRQGKRAATKGSAAPHAPTIRIALRTMFAKTVCASRLRRRRSSHARTDRSARARRS
jgi:hypothetical protein